MEGALPPTASDEQRRPFPWPSALVGSLIIFAITASLTVSRQGPWQVLSVVFLLTMLFRNQGLWRDLGWQVLPGVVVVGVLGMAGIVPPFENQVHAWTDGAAGAYWFALCGIALGVAWVAFHTAYGVAGVLRSIRAKALRVPIVATLHGRMRFRKPILSTLGFLLCMVPAMLFATSGLNPTWLEVYDYVPPPSVQPVVAAVLVVLVLGSMGWGAIAGLRGMDRTMGGLRPGHDSASTT